MRFCYINKRLTTNITMQQTDVGLNRQILKLTIPNTISNITIPLLGITDLAIAGRIGNSVISIGALAVGTSIFGMIYWNCSFLRMGTSGQTAQAFGAKNNGECANLLLRSTIASMVIAIAILILQKPIWTMSSYIIDGGNEIMSLTYQYFAARIWAAPASIWMFAIQGWLIGMQDSKTPMYISVFSNIINIVASCIMVFEYNWGISGIAWGTVVAQYASLALALVVIRLKYYDQIKCFNISESLKMRHMIKFFNINRDIFLRTLCVVAAYTFFTSASARFGPNTLACNQLLMQLFTLYSYMLDGVAFAAESLVGRFIGERNYISLHKCLKWLLVWGGAVAFVYAFVFIVAWQQILSVFNPEPEIIDYAKRYIGWIIAVPIVGFIPFIVDGMLVGSTLTKPMRDSVFISLCIYFAVFYSLSYFIGNTALWLAFIIFLSMRGAILWKNTKGLQVIIDLAK